ncbi:SDR family NAD(P)-dependent oxidoreductase [Fimbriiglobus ruber]|uniref:3-oxoacyl-[acyl-carrier protein] reductase n=1 Tax=Fimbriiglobus ruber TaxID=1908690 RepID=A0A225DEG9_9BACT|nr:SDR family oxidoreductase [Fimbriiglobus ruber]OWK39852.1 3-oxoacyl-[acyl-carrier protein] reductase [Fimbriiglobus ruber]
MQRSLLLAALGIGGYLTYRALKPKFDFTDKHVVITGGTRGLGLVLARALADRGARLSVCSRGIEEVERAGRELAERGTRVFAAPCDVTERDQVRTFAADARRHNGPIDVLINNAGVIQVGPWGEMRDEDFEQSLRTHFWASLSMIREVLPEMTTRRAGRIVNISSIGGKIAVPHLLPYSVGKFALAGLSDGLRAEVARHGIVVTTVCPGLMRTGSHVNAQFKGRHTAEYAWFALGDSIPGLSVDAESAARAILTGCARGDAEVIVGLPAKVAILARALCPNLMAGALEAANRWVLPDAGGIGAEVASGLESRGALPAFVTTLTDRAAVANNELPAGHGVPIPSPRM